MTRGSRSQIWVTGGGGRLDPPRITASRDGLVLRSALVHVPCATVKLSEVWDRGRHVSALADRRCRLGLFRRVGYLPSRPPPGRFPCFPSPRFTYTTLDSLPAYLPLSATTHPRPHCHIVLHLDKPRRLARMGLDRRPDPLLASPPSGRSSPASNAWIPGNNRSPSRTRRRQPWRMPAHPAPPLPRLRP